MTNEAINKAITEVLPELSARVKDRITDGLATENSCVFVTLKEAETIIAALKAMEP